MFHKQMVEQPVGVMKMRAFVIFLVALLFINYGEALWCYGCFGKNCSGRREECGSLLRDPVCATIDAPTFYVKGCMSEYICKGQQQAPGEFTVLKLCFFLFYGIRKIKVFVICLVALLFINCSEALWCYACARKGCSGRKEECGRLLKDPVCALIDASQFYMKGCMSDSVSKEQQKALGTTATCCNTNFCNR
ncbi:hypothetical protein KOW79_004909 [Hemibagrus wyckioides]|uniref:UPAR/Ly6 domain-containing protein n=1 Tax=Hemibagrus wyckioides TaxID=337641 RepID=A0A9D3NXX6_9TELE|nr:hypothetical protein KOW79_004909 [Hemibagrus wyckioides]